MTIKRSLICMGLGCAGLGAAVISFLTTEVRSAPKLVLADILIVLGAVFMVISTFGIYGAFRRGPDSSKERIKHRIVKAPGTRLMSVVEFLFSPTTVEETFKTTLADWHLEYFEALQQRKFVKSRWISVRYTYRFILAMGLSKAFSAIKGFKTVIK